MNEARDQLLVTGGVITLPDASIDADRRHRQLLAECATIDRGINGAIVAVSTASGFLLYPSHGTQEFDIISHSVLS